MKRTPIACMVAMAAAYGMPTVANAQPAGEIEEVVTIGTRVPGRTATETSVPIDVINQNALQQSGEIELGAVLQKMAPSFNYSRTTVGDGTDLMRPATLRGMGPDQVLVLVNGKRRHNQAWIHTQEQIGKGNGGTDLNAIPMAALQRVEVLRDGAAAQYGSDAIAGVINLELKEDTEGGVISVKYGETSEGDGEQTFVSANGGLGNEQFYLNATAEWSEIGNTDRADPVSGTGFPQLDGQTLMRIGNAEQDGYAVWLNSGFYLNEDSKIYAFGGISKREGESGGFFRYPNQADRSVPQVYPNGFLPLITTETEDKSLSVGWETKLNDTWSLDASVAWGENVFSFGAKDSINASIAGEYLQNNPGATDAMIAANAGPRSGDSGSLTFEQTTYNIDLSGEMDFFTGQPLYIATGVEYRDEEFSLGKGDFASYSCGSSATSKDVPSVINPATLANCGFQAFPGYSPRNVSESKRDRHSFAVYVDVENDITEDWTLAAAARYEDYSDAGDSTTGKISTRYQLTDNFALRGALSTGFRAPSLAQQGYTSIITGISSTGFLEQTLTASEGTAIPVAYGVSELKHETSVSYSAGFVWQATDTIDLTVDIYRVEVDDRIALGGALDGTGNPAAQAALAAEGVNSAQFYSNAIDTTTDGLDLVATWALVEEGDWGSLDLTFLLHRNKTDIDSINTPAGTTSDQIFNKAQQDRIETGQPREREMLAFDWAKNQLSATLRFNRYGETKTSFWTWGNFGGGGPIDETEIKTSSAILTDLEMRYDFDGGLRVSLGANNLFDEQPDEIDNQSFSRVITNGSFKYPWESTPYGTDGAFYYGRIDYNF